MDINPALYRLKKTGIVDVKNPVEEAIKGGRFEELDWCMGDKPCLFIV